MWYNIIHSRSARSCPTARRNAIFNATLVLPILDLLFCLAGRPFAIIFVCFSFCKYHNKSETTQRPTRHSFALWTNSSSCHWWTKRSFVFYIIIQYNGIPFHKYHKTLLNNSSCHRGTKRSFLLHIMIQYNDPGLQQVEVHSTLIYIINIYILQYNH